MGKEIEHKYLVISDVYKKMAKASYKIVQGYLSRDKERVIRIRIIDERAFLTIKGKNSGDSRLEYEYEIPVSDAEEILKLCLGKPIEKIRWIVEYSGYKWEIDEFLNPPIGTIAEIELSNSHYDYCLPPFVGEEVTGNPQYYNSNIGI